MRPLREHAQTRYYACFAVTLSATMGVAFSANLITLYLFYEILTLITYPLVVHKETEEAQAGARPFACGECAPRISIPSFLHALPNCVSGHSPRNCSSIVGSRVVM